MSSTSTSYLYTIFHILCECSRLNLHYFSPLYIRAILSSPIARQTQERITKYLALLQHVTVSGRKDLGGGNDREHQGHLKEKSANGELGIEAGTSLNKGSGTTPLAGTQQNSWKHSRMT